MMDIIWDGLANGLYAGFTVVGFLAPLLVPALIAVVAAGIIAVCEIVHDRTSKLRRRVEKLEEQATDK